MAYGNANGMLSTEGNGGRAPSAIIDDEGQIWFPTLEGISVVNPESLQINLLPPPVEIENIEIDREKTSFKNKEIMNDE